MAISLDFRMIRKPEKADVDPQVRLAVSRAVSKLARETEKQATRKVASDTNLPLKAVKNRLSRQGSIKSRRITMRRATANGLPAMLLSAWMRGLPVYQVAQAQTAAGVTARGGRFYKGAFVPLSQRGRTAKGRLSKRIPRGALVFKRRSNNRLMVPKIGLRRRLDREIRSFAASAEGRRIVEAEFQRTLRVLR